MMVRERSGRFLASSQVVPQEHKLLSYEVRTKAFFVALPCFIRVPSGKDVWICQKVDF